jgi:hypothetical protein
MAQRLVVAAAVAYLLLLGWMIGNTSYDAWGLLVVLPVFGAVGVVIMRRLFTGRLRTILNVMYLGLATKLLGTAARYYVGFEAYDGGIDAQEYHLYAVDAARDVWEGRADFLSIFPGGTGTPFTEGMTALVYTLTGTSKMGGFVAFSFLAYIGTAFFVKAACVAIPGLAMRKYALLCVLAPSIIYWPASIGKEALMIFFLGIATYGIASLVSRPPVLVPLLIAAAGLIGATFIRPHLVGVWMAGLFPALLVALLRGRDVWHEGHKRKLDRALFLPIVVIAAIGLILVASATVQYLNPGGGDSQGGATDLVSIIDETSRRTAQAGSAFTPPSVTNPANWPFAAVRTLTRPLPMEARGLSQMIVAAEILVFLCMCLWSYRRVLNAGALAVRNAYVGFAITTLFLAGLAYSSFGNLAVLSRQRSLVVPLMLLLVCVPPLARRERGGPEIEETIADQTNARQTSEHARQTNALQKSSMSPSSRAQFDRGGAPTSTRPRQVSIGPPDGRATKPDDIFD